MANAKPKKSDEKVLIMIPYVEGEGEDDAVGFYFGGERIEDIDDL